jgi:hypothetical protein
VLQGVQPEIGEFGDLFTRSPDTEDATSVLGALLAGEEVVAESSVTTRHVFESRAGSPVVRTRDVRDQRFYARSALGDTGV